MPEAADWLETPTKRIPPDRGTDRHPVVHATLVSKKNQRKFFEDDIAKRENFPVDGQEVNESEDQMFLIYLKLI